MWSPLHAEATVAPFDSEYPTPHLPHVLPAPAPIAMPVQEIAAPLLRGPRPLAVLGAMLVIALSLASWARKPHLEARAAPVRALPAIETAAAGAAGFAVPAMADFETVLCARVLC